MTSVQGSSVSCARRDGPYLPQLEEAYASICGQLHSLWVQRWGILNLFLFERKSHVILWAFHSRLKVSLPSVHRETLCMAHTAIGNSAVQARDVGAVFLNFTTRCPSVACLALQTGSFVPSDFF